MDPDVIGLQEVDHYDDFFRPSLSDYDGIFMPKQDSPCLRVPGNSGPDGIALFYKKKRFTLKDQFTEYLKEEGVASPNQGLIVVVLEDNVSSKILICAVVHFKAKIGFEFRRHAQAKSCLEIIDSVNKKYKGAPIVWCGDFNGESYEPFYELIKASRLNFESAYLSILKEEPVFSTWKIRPLYEEKRLIDYIWFTSDSIVTSSVLLPMEEDKVPETKFPSANHPSDHILLCADFRYI